MHTESIWQMTDSEGGKESEQNVMTTSIVTRPAKDNDKSYAYDIRRCGWDPDVIRRRFLIISVASECPEIHGGLQREKSGNSKREVMELVKKVDSDRINDMESG